MHICGIIYILFNRRALKIKSYIRIYARNLGRSIFNRLFVTSICYPRHQYHALNVPWVGKKDVVPLWYPLGGGVSFRNSRLGRPIFLCFGACFCFTIKQIV